jgi:hypothetical protein
MSLGKVFERFEKRSPVSVMFRGTLENVFARESMDELFEQTAQRQKSGELLFSAVVDLLSLVVCGIRRSVHDAYQNAEEPFEVSIKSVYNKLNGTEPEVSRELVRRPAERLGRVIRQMKATLPSPLPQYRVKIVDGNHFPGTDHRLKELRTTRSGALPGQALVVLEPELMLATEVIPCEDGHAQERSLFPPLLESAEAGDLWVADRNFCTTDFLFGLAARGACFAIRQHGSTLTWETVGRRRKRGRCKTGVVYEQNVRLSNRDGQSLLIRRVTLKLDKPTRKGDEEIHVLTNVPGEDADAAAIAMLYRERWTVENAFQELSQALSSEINALGYPKAALLSFSVALLAYNALSVAKAAMRAVHGDDASPEKISGYYLTGEISAAYHGMMIAIPEPEWTRAFASLTVPSLARILKDLAHHVNIRQFRKHHTGPKKPRPKRTSGKKQKHVSTARILAQRKRCTRLKC